MWALGTPGAHLHRAPWQMAMWRADRRRFEAGLHAEVETGEQVRAVGQVLGAHGFAADFLPPARPRVHGVGQIREGNVDYALLFGRQLWLIDGKSLTSGRYAVHRPSCVGRPTTDPVTLAAQVQDSAFFDTIEHERWRRPSHPARSLQSQAREMRLAARAAGTDVQIDTCLIVDNDLARLEFEPWTDPRRPWTASHFAHADGTPLRVESPLTTTRTRFETDLLAAAAIFDAPAPEVWDWLASVYADSEARRQARIESERRSGAVPAEFLAG